MEGFQTQWDQLCAKRAVHGPQTTLQGIAGCVIKVMDDWEQPHTNATLLKPTKHYYSLFKAIQGHEKAVWKVDLAIYGYSIVVRVWIVHEITENQWLAFYYMLGLCSPRALLFIIMYTLTYFII